MSEIFVVFYIVLQAVGVISAVHAIMATRTPQGAIAWGISLISMPLFVVPLYWVFGRSRFDGYVNVWRKISAGLEDELGIIQKKITPYILRNSIHFPEYEAAMQLAKSPLIKGNEVELLIDGELTYESLHDGIEQATSYILFQFYILRPDTSGNRFKEHLIRKAEQGVRVYILYDELGSSELTSEWLSDLRQYGVSIRRFNPHNRKKHFQANFRNHRKIVVVDGHSAWLGGLNIGDDYLGHDKKLSPWRDTHIKITGPAAIVAQSTFCSDWYYSDEVLINDLNWIPDSKYTGDDEDGKDVMVVSSGPSDDLETASLFFTNAMNTARRRIWIATPYFIPDESTLATLQIALLRGIDVRIITPQLNDNWFVQHAANHYLSMLSQQGARIFFYNRGFMHQKVMLIDDRISMIGTVNFDNRSFRLNFEIMGVIVNQAFTVEIESMLEKDISNSVEIIDYNLSEQSYWERFKARASVLMAPVL